MQRPAIGDRDDRRVILAAANGGGIRGDRTLPRGSVGVRGTPPALAALVGECLAAGDGCHREDGAQCGPHPPSAMTATTSAVPSPTIMSPTFQLP